MKLQLFFSVKYIYSSLFFSVLRVITSISPSIFNKVSLIGNSLQRHHTNSRFLISYFLSLKELIWIFFIPMHFL